MCECVCWHIYTGYKNIRKKSNIILQFATFSQNGHDLPSWQLVLILLVTHRLCKLPVYFNITLPLLLIINFPTYFYTFSNLFPRFYLIISPLLSTLISLFPYPFILLLFLALLIPIILL